MPRHVARPYLKPRFKVELTNQGLRVAARKAAITRPLSRIKNQFMFMRQLPLEVSKIARHCKRII